MFAIQPWHKHVLLVVFAAFAVQRAWVWVDTVTHAQAADAPSAQPSLSAPHDPAIDRAIATMREGLTELRQAATTGEPAMLQEAEKTVLRGLLDGLDASVVGGRLDAVRYRRMADAVAEVEGLFKYIPYRLEVRPGPELPPIALMLRRSPWPMIQARPASPWQAAMVEGAVRLTLRAPKPTPAP